MATVAKAGNGWTTVVYTNTGVEQWVALKLHLALGQAKQVWSLKAHLERKHKVTVFIEKRCAKHAEGKQCRFGKRCRNSHNLAQDEVLLKGPAKGIKAAEKELKKKLQPVKDYDSQQVLRQTAKQHASEVRTAKTQSSTYLACVQFKTTPKKLASATTANLALYCSSDKAAASVASLQAYPALGRVTAAAQLSLDDDQLSQASADTCTSSETATQHATQQVSDLYHKLTGLAALKVQGLLTEEEFTCAKAKLLGL